MSNLQEYFGALTPARDRRLQARITPASLTYVELGDTNDGIVLNISETGMAVAVAHLFVVGEYLPCIRFQLPRSSQSVEISAQIVWLAESKKGAGLQFVDLTPDARNQIANWIASEKPAPEFEQLPKPLRRDRQPLEISSRKSRRIFSNPSVRDEEAATRYAKMFPSECTYAKPTTVDEIKPQKIPLPTPAGIHTDAGVSMFGAAVEISAGDVPQSTAASFPSEHARNFAPKPIKTSILELGEGLMPEPVTQAPTGKVESSPDRVDDSPSHLYVSEISAQRGFKFQFATLVFLFSVIGFTVGRTVGRGPLGKRLQGAQKSVLPVDATSPALPSRPVEVTSRTSTPPAVKAFNTPSVESPAPETEESRLGSPSAPSHNARSADSTSSVGPTESSSQETTRSNIDSDSSSSSNKRDDATPAEENSKESTGHSESFANVPSADLNSSPTIESKSSTGPESSTEGNVSNGLAARNTSPPATPEPELAHPPTAVGPKSASPRNPAPRNVTPATGPASYSSPSSAILVTAPAEGSKPLRLIFPEKPIAVSSSFAIRSQLSVLISPEPGPAVAHQPARLQAGVIVSYVKPRQPRRGDRYRSTETVKVRVTIGQQGQVMDIRPVSGPIFLLSSAVSAIRLWRYKPTLLNERPVQAQQDVTIEFRLPR